MSTCTHLALYGLGNFMIIAILFASIDMSFLETMHPRIFPCLTMNLHLSWFKHMRYSQNLSKMILRGSMSSSLALDHQYVLQEKT